MELLVLLEFLKFLSLGVDVVRHFIARKREKALIAALESCNQCPKLENKQKEIP